jgi:hypothetical protein
VVKLAATDADEPPIAAWYHMNKNVTVSPGNLPIATSPLPQPDCDHTPIRPRHPASPRRLFPTTSQIS